MIPQIVVSIPRRAGFAAIVLPVGLAALLSGCCGRGNMRPVGYAYGNTYTTSTTSNVDGEVYVSTSPPAAITEFQPAAPGSGFAWVSGYWDWTGYDWFWINGQWVADRPGYAWVTPRVSFVGGRWLYNRGYWNGHAHGGIRDYHYGRPAGAPPVVRGQSSGGSSPAAGWRGQPAGSYNPPSAPPSHNVGSPPSGGVAGSASVSGTVSGSVGSFGSRPGFDAPQPAPPPAGTVTPPQGSPPPAGGAAFGSAIGGIRVNPAPPPPPQPTSGNPNPASPFRAVPTAGAPPPQPTFGGPNPASPFRAVPPAGAAQPQPQPQYRTVPPPQRSGFGSIFGRQNPTPTTSQPSAGTRKIPEPSPFNRVSPQPLPAAPSRQVAPAPATPVMRPMRMPSSPVAGPARSAPAPAPAPPPPNPGRRNIGGIVR